MERSASVTQGETHGSEQEPRYAGDQDPAVRDPRPDGPMDEELDTDRDESRTRRRSVRRPDVEWPNA